MHGSLPEAPSGRRLAGGGWRLTLVTDTWRPQTNGVVTTLETVLGELSAWDIHVTVIHPYLFRTVPLPGYPEIPLVATPWRVRAALLAAAPDAVHIATEGPLGLAARRVMVGAGRAFTTSLHTKFPEYFNARIGTPLSLGYRLLRWFHGAAATTLCTTASHVAELESQGLTNLRVWGRGVDTRVFRPCPGVRRLKPRPRLLYVGRVSVEKNIEAFLTLEVDANKVVVGDGPARVDLERRYRAPTGSVIGRGRSWFASTRRRTCSCFRPGRTPSDS